jgi:hypothetical protein
MPLGKFDCDIFGAVHKDELAAVSRANVTRAAQMRQNVTPDQTAGYGIDPTASLHARHLLYAAADRSGETA